MVQYLEMYCKVVVCLGTLVSPLAVSRVDCRHLNTALLAATALATLGLGLSFNWHMGTALGGWHSPVSQSQTLASLGGFLYFPSTTDNCP